MEVSPRLAGLATDLRTANRPDDVPMGDLIYVPMDGGCLEVWMVASPVEIRLGVIERVEQLPDGALRLVGEPWESNSQLVLLPSFPNSDHDHDGGEQSHHSA